MNIHESGPIWDAFLRDIVEHPDDDAPRLILADWLEEQSGPIQKARAEFIRLQYEGTDKAMQQARRMLEHCFPQWWLPTWTPLERYHYQPRWLHRVSGPARQYYHVEPPLAAPALTVMLHGPRSLSATYRRGFVEHLLVPITVLEEHVGRLFTTCPLKRVELLDCKPVNDGQFGWCWYNRQFQPMPMNIDSPYGNAILPTPIFAHLPPPKGYTKSEWRRLGKEAIAHRYADEADARDACSQAIIAWGRELQGMPVLEERSHA